jgi:BRI1 kinase inhibitor 1
MSHRLGRVVSDLGHANPRNKATDHGLHHQSTRSTIGNSSNVAGGRSSKSKQRLSLLFTGVSAWRRSEGTGDNAGSAKCKTNNKQRTEGTGSKQRRGLLDDIGRQVVSKYWLMVEQLFTASSSSATGVWWKRDGSSSSEIRQRRRPHTFASSSRRGGGCSSNTPSNLWHNKKGRPPSAPASLRGSPANSGHLSVGGSSSVKMPSTSELSTMEELHSAVQAAIEHCKNTRAPPPTCAGKQAAAGGDDDGRQAGVNDAGGGSCMSLRA